MVKNMNKDKILSLTIGAILVISTIGIVSYMAFNQGRLYQQALDEGIGVNKEDAPSVGAYMTFTVIDEDGKSTLAWAGHNLICLWNCRAYPTLS